MTKKIAVYAGSFDLVTKGHLWIIKEASLLFDTLIVAIGENRDKKYMFSLPKRYEMLKTTTHSLNNVIITQFENQFLVNYAKDMKARFLVRGVRDSTDFEYEKRVHYVNLNVDRELSTIFLIPPPEYSYISSTLVKSLLGLEEWETLIDKYVPLEVINLLKVWI
jgi:pantetheine-phosphate adenylyltransferase